LVIKLSILTYRDVIEKKQKFEDTNKKSNAILISQIEGLGHLGTQWMGCILFKQKNDILLVKDLLLQKK
jgi:hypothetical protein